MEQVLMDPIYLDHNASTPILAEVLEAMLPFLTTHFGNPSSSHIYGIRSKEAVEKARAQLAQLVNCKMNEIYFTANGTESNNLAIFGMSKELKHKHVVTSISEHPATLAPMAYLAANGFQLTKLPVDSNGVIDAKGLCKEPVGLASFIHAHNETGVIAPIFELAQKIHAQGGLIHIDAAQSVGKIPVDFKALQVDAMSLVGHKFYAPKGVGALIVKQGTRILNLSHGAPHERGLRPGTENVASIVGLGMACEIARKTLASEMARMKQLKQLFIKTLSDVKDIHFNGSGAPQLPNTISVRFPNVSGNKLLSACPSIAASTGSACHSGHDEAPKSIVAMGVSEKEAMGTVRISMGRGTTEADVNLASKALLFSWSSLR
jgi:cysteine desulfurase